MLDLTGHVAAVTGAKGIGLAIAEALVDRGASVVVAARTAADVERAAAALAARGHGPARGVVADVRSESDCERVVTTAVEVFGRLVLINNAGVGTFVDVEEMSTDAWRAQLATNLDGVFFCCRAAIPHLKRSGGWIINVASVRLGSAQRKIAQAVFGWLWFPET